MNVLLKERQSAMKDKIKEIDIGLTLIREKIEMQTRFIQSLKTRSNTLMSDKEKVIATTIAEVAILTEEIDTLHKEAQTLLNLVGDSKEKQESALAKLNTLYTQIKGNVRSLTNEISFYEKNDMCPTCQQGICAEHKSKEIMSKHSRITEMEGGMYVIGQKHKETQDALNETRESLATVQEKQGKINTITSSRVAAERHIKQLRIEVDRLKEDRSDETTEQGKLDKMQSIEMDIAKNKTDANENSSVFSAASVLLKDTGIKKKIISHYLPIINKTINAYLTRMNFFVSFELNDNFEERIRSRHRDDFTYESFSEGEKRRIDLALLFAWRAIAAQKNSVNCNLLILDEILDGSLDDNATDAFLDILKTIDSSVRVFVISHKNPESLGDKFKNRIVFKKKNNFSSLTEYTN